MGTEPYTAAPPERPQQALALLSAITELRLRYLRSGYTPLPCTGKIPALLDWPKAKIDAAQVNSWGLFYRGSLNIGIRTTYNPAVDIDVYDADMVRTIEAALLKYLPQDKAILRRVGMAPKRLIPFCCRTPFKKCAVKFASPDGTSHKVEVLCDGQQFISEGWHPDTSEPYAWLGDKLVDVLPTRLPLLDEATAHKFLADVRGIITAKGWAEVGESKESRDYQGDNTAGAKKSGGHDPARNNSYARAALDRECEAVANASKGSRNDTLNRAAFNLHQLVAGGELDADEVTTCLTAAAEACGLAQDDGEKSVADTIASGAKAGQEKPRHAPEREDAGDPNPATNGGDPNSGTAPRPSGKWVELVRASTIEQQAIDWLWKPRLA
jgi:hypothetical protein